jgi:hypothetical protein
MSTLGEQETHAQTPATKPGTESNQNPHKSSRYSRSKLLLDSSKINASRCPVGEGKSAHSTPPGINSRRPPNQWLTDTSDRRITKTKTPGRKKITGTNRSPAVVPAAEKG